MLELERPDIFRSVLESLSTGIYLVDRERKILFWNEGAQRITGFLQQDVVGRLPREHLLVTSVDSHTGNDEHPDPVEQAFRDGKPTITEASILHKEGYRIPIVLRTVAIRDGHGTVVLAAESFDVNLSAQSRSRRHAAIAQEGHLDLVACVPCQAFMQERMREKLTRFAVHQADFAIVLVEADQMDHFAKTFGKGVIPIVLRVVAHAIENCVRPDDLVGRWYGNQFIVLLDGCKEEEVYKVGERMRKMISDSHFEWWGDHVAVAAALGGAGATAGDTEDSLLARAARSLKESMATGGNCMTVVE